MRITCGDGMIQRVLLPKLAPLLQQYPDIKLEFDMSYALRDIVADRFDAGVRWGKTIDRDMIAVPIGPPLRMVVAASPEYFTRYPVPQHPNDLMAQDCINQRMPSSGGLYVWDFEKDGEKINVRVDGSLIFNTVPPQIDAALAGLGVVLLPEDDLQSYLESGQLVRVLEDWCPVFEGYHLYYPSRRQPSPAFSLVVNALRYESRPRQPG